MRTSHDLALTVKQHAEDQYIWVLMAVADPAPASDALYYIPACSAATPQSSYSSAFSVGMAELRRVAATGSAAAD
jgi:hypothetical protein